MSFQVGTVTPSGLFMPDRYAGRAARASAGSACAVRSGSRPPLPVLQERVGVRVFGIAECGFRMADGKTEPRGAPLQPAIRNPQSAIRNSLPRALTPSLSRSTGRGRTLFGRQDVDCSRQVQV